jgi:hypothetical protein
MNINPVENKQKSSPEARNFDDPITNSPQLPLTPAWKNQRKPIDHSAQNGAA